MRKYINGWGEVNQSLIDDFANKEDLLSQRICMINVKFTDGSDINIAATRLNDLFGSRGLMTEDCNTFFPFHSVSSMTFIKDLTIGELLGTQEETPE